MKSFRITGLSPEPFAPLFGLPNDALKRFGAIRTTADDRTPGFPDRIELRDAKPGETLLLLNYVHQPAESPYRSSHAIFVREGATLQFDRVNEIPQLLRVRPLSLRGFDETGMMIDADVIDGTQVEQLIERLFRNEQVAYVHAHFAKRGCFAARIDRA